MNIKKIITINEAIKRILPKTYPRPKLVLCEDEEHMLTVHGWKEKAFALFDPSKDSIYIPIKDTLELSDVDIAKLLLHEYAHARAGEKHGWASKEYSDEEECDRFACRWVKKLNDVIGETDNVRFCGWRIEEVEWLKTHYPTATKEQITKRLDRSWGAIRSKARLLGVRRDK